MSGDFGGTMQDSQSGAGTATATFAQHGNNVGGSITFTRASGTVTAETSFTIATTNAISGGLVIDYPSGTQCTYTTTGSFDPNAGVLSGTFTAVSNCIGDAGSYSLTQSCTAQETSSDRRSAMARLLPC
jgi:hypothetical protein